MWFLKTFYYCLSSVHYCEDQTYFIIIIIIIVIIITIIVEVSKRK